MMILEDGSVATDTGWYQDLHGHRAMLYAGEKVPHCPHDDNEPSFWRRLVHMPEDQSLAAAA